MKDSRSEREQKCREGAVRDQKVTPFRIGVDQLFNFVVNCGSYVCTNKNKQVCMKVD